MSAFRAVAVIDDILSSPELLAGFAESFFGRDDAELIVHAPQFSGAEAELEAGLQPLADALGLDADDAARVVVLTDPCAGDELARTAHALYAPASRDGFDTLPVAASAQALRGLADGLVHFTCNVCGAENVVERLPREGKTCGCDSSARFRSVVRAISLALFEQDLPLSQFPSRPELRGLGMTDWGGYADPLAERCGFINTFLHRDPHFDVTAPDPALEGTFDYVVSTEVFEHVAPPVVDGLAAVRRLLKPGGVLVLTVPWRYDGETIEHFPELHDYDIVERDGKRVLVNTTVDGRVQEFDRLCFHGGEGETLELRQFSKSGLEADLAAAGFGEVEFLERPDSPYGVDWSPERDAAWPVLAWVPDPLELNARAKRMVVRYDDVIADPSLIAAAAATADDQTTLVVYAPDADPAEAEAKLAALLDGVELDVLLLAVPGSREVERRLADSI